MFYLEMPAQTALPLALSPSEVVHKLWTQRSQALPSKDPQMTGYISFSKLPMRTGKGSPGFRASPRRQD